MITCYKFIRFHCASNNFTFWSGTTLLPSSVLVSTSWLVILVKAFRNGYVVACSSARRSAADKNEMKGWRTVTCLAKMIQHSSTADLLNLRDVTRLVATEHVWKKYSVLKSRSLYI